MPCRDTIDSSFVESGRERVLVLGIRNNDGTVVVLRGEDQLFLSRVVNAGD